MERTFLPAIFVGPKGPGEMSKVIPLLVTHDQRQMYLLSPAFQVLFRAEALRAIVEQQPDELPQDPSYTLKIPHADGRVYEALLAGIERAEAMGRIINAKVDLTGVAILRRQ